MKDECLFVGVRERRETQKAILFDVLGSFEMWVPKSQIISRTSEAVLVTAWWADASGYQWLYQQAEKVTAERVSSEVSDMLPRATSLYRKLALKYHPDRNPDAEEFMSDINQFWQTVKDDMRGKP